jgi:hypothetical protein
MRLIPKHESLPLTLWGDLDGKTVEQVVAMLQAYPTGAVIDARTRDGRIGEEEEYFVIGWEDEDGPGR